MKIIGCDFHPSSQQIAVLELATGESVEKALSHERKEEVRAFYAALEGSVRVGIEASGQSQWFERMLGAHGGRAGRTAVALASSQAGAHAHAGEEPVAGAGAESGRATEVEAVEPGGEKAAGVVAATALGEPTESRVTPAARSTGRVDCRTGLCGGRG